MGLLSWIVIGGLAGWVASLIMKTDASQGIIGNIIVGVIGGLIGGFIMNLLGFGAGINGFSLESFGVATLGAVILLFIINAIKKA